jgi:hypothetical protein
MNVQVLSQAEVSSRTSINGMVVPARSDWKHFHTTVDRGSIRKYLVNIEDLTQTINDVFRVK